MRCLFVCLFVAGSIHHLQNEANTDVRATYGSGSFEDAASGMAVVWVGPEHAT